MAAVRAHDPGSPARTDERALRDGARRARWVMDDLFKGALPIKEAPARPAPPDPLPQRFDPPCANCGAPNPMWVTGSYRAGTAKKFCQACKELHLCR